VDVAAIESKKDECDDVELHYIKEDIVYDNVIVISIEVLNIEYDSRPLNLQFACFISVCLHCTTLHSMINGTR
jgi:hypothetical protein